MIKAFSIYDKKAQVYMRPFYAENEIFASREIFVAMQNEKITLAIFPEDFDLYCLATFEEKTGELLASPKPVYVTSILACKNMMVKQELEKQENV